MVLCDNLNTEQHTHKESRSGERVCFYLRLPSSSSLSSLPDWLRSAPHDKSQSLDSGGAASPHPREGLGS